jgi:hypothetical protein
VDRSTAGIIKEKLNRSDLLQLLHLVRGETVVLELVRVRRLLAFWGKWGEEDDTS